MKLKPDLIRNILTTIEQHSDGTKSMGIFHCSEYPLLKDYSLLEISYHINQLNDAGFLIGVSASTMPVDDKMQRFYFVRDLSYKGHEFLGNIGDENNWGHMKSIASQLGIQSLQGFATIASGVITQLINSRLGIL